MKRIILHWTAGKNIPNEIELQHYHRIVDGGGKIYNGKFSIEDNINCNDGKYAEHTGGGNTESIGVSMCGMMGFSNSKSVGSFPLTKIQCETTFQLCAKLAKQYNIPIDKEHIFTHHTYNLSHGIKTGKIDIIFLPPYPHVLKDDVINYIISRIKGYSSGYEH